MEVLARGSLAWYESTVGLVKCKVTSIERDRHGSVSVGVVLTTGYQRGIPFTTTSLHVFPRRAVRRLRGSYGTKYVVSPFSIEESSAP